MPLGCCAPRGTEDLEGLSSCIPRFPAEPGRSLGSYAVRGARACPQAYVAAPSEPCLSRRVTVTRRIRKSSGGICEGIHAFFELSERIVQSAAFGFFQRQGRQQPVVQQVCASVGCMCVTYTRTHRETEKLAATDSDRDRDRSRQREKRERRERRERNTSHVITHTHTHLLRFHGRNVVRGRLHHVLVALRVVVWSALASSCALSDCVCTKDITDICSERARQRDTERDIKVYTDQDISVVEERNVFRCACMCFVCP